MTYEPASERERLSKYAFRFFGGPFDGQSYAFPNRQTYRSCFTATLASGEPVWTKHTYKLMPGEDIYTLLEVKQVSGEEVTQGQ